MPTTSRLKLIQIQGTDTVSSYPATENANMTTLDGAMLWATPSTFSARPAANTVIAGTLHRSTDNSVVAVSDGSSWHTLLADSLGPPVGAMQQYGGSADPPDADGATRWLVCDGRAISRATYATLFIRLSTTYGVGNGSSTFNIPDLRGRVSLGAINGGTGAGSGPNDNAHAQVSRGSASGESNHTLSTSEMPSHTHSDTGHSHSDSGHSHYVHGAPINPGDAAWTSQSVVAGAGVKVPSNNNFAGGLPGALYFTDAAGANIQTGHASLQSQGNSASHNNLPPYGVVNHIIRVL